MDVRIVMPVKGFLSAALREGVVAELQSQNGVSVGTFRASRLPDSGPDVIARILQDQETCELQGETLLGKLFLSVLTTGAL